MLVLWPWLKDAWHRGSWKIMVMAWRNQSLLAYEEILAMQSNGRMKKNEKSKEIRVGTMEVSQLILVNGLTKKSTVDQKLTIGQTLFLLYETLYMIIVWVNEQFLMEMDPFDSKKHALYSN